MSHLFSNYWEFQETRKKFGTISRPVLRWFPSEEFNDVEKLYFDYLKDCETILDIGAGDERLKKKFLAHGFKGQYLTCDPADNMKHDFKSLEEVSRSGRKFDAIVLLELIEHLPLDVFHQYIPEAVQLLNHSGRFILSTPNAQAINATWAGDYTHIKTYPLGDLWAIFTLLGFDCRPYRVQVTDAKITVVQRFRLFLAKMITHILGVDYATGVILMGRRKL